MSATRERFEAHFGYQDWRKTIEGDYVNTIAQARWVGYEAAMADMDELLGVLRSIQNGIGVIIELGRVNLQQEETRELTLRALREHWDAAETVLARYGKS